MTKRFPRSLGAVAIAAALATFAGLAASQQPGEAPMPVNPSGYLVASDGRPVLSGSGACMRTTQWVLANAVEPCDQIARVSVPVPVVVSQERAAPPPPPPPAPAPVAAVQPEPKQQVVIQKITLSTDVLFEFGKAELKDAGKQKLEEFASQVKGAKIDEIVVIGHADRIGSQSYNEKLSEARAQSVKEYLAERGAQTNVISAQGKGESAPVTGDQCKKMTGKKLIECLQPDRRVEIEVLGSREVAATEAPATGGTR